MADSPMKMLPKLPEARKLDNYTYAMVVEVQCQAFKAGLDKARDMFLQHGISAEQWGVVGAIDALKLKIWSGTHG